MKDFAHIPNDNPIVSAMLATLRKISPIPYDVKNWYGIGEVPLVPIHRPDSYKMGLLGKLAIDIDGKFIRQCANYYPCGGGIGWHSDWATPGWRVYAHQLRGEFPVSTFRYRELAIAEESEGAVLFRVGPDCWHAAECGRDTERFVCGIQITEEFAKELQNAYQGF